ncbi:TPA: hypothetical protein ACFJLC_001269, partial [Neisseria gonorrhoeae]
EAHRFIDSNVYDASNGFRRHFLHNSRHFPSFPTTPQSRNPSFPRRRESGPLTRRESIGNN